MAFHCSHETFVLVWQTASSIDEVCRRLGISRKVARSRANVLRAKGVKMKKFGYAKNLNLETLRQLAESLLPAEQAPTSPECD